MRGSPADTVSKDRHCDTYKPPHGGAPTGDVGIVGRLETVCPRATLPEVQASRRAIADRADDLCANHFLAVSLAGLQMGPQPRRASRRPGGQ